MVNRTPFFFWILWHGLFMKGSVKRLKFPGVSKQLQAAVRWNLPMSNTTCTWAAWCRCIYNICRACGCLSHCLSWRSRGQNSTLQQYHGNLRAPPQCHPPRRNRALIKGTVYDPLIRPWSGIGGVPLDSHDSMQLWCSKRAHGICWVLGYKLRTFLLGVVWVVSFSPGLLCIINSSSCLVRLTWNIGKISPIVDVGWHLIKHDLPLSSHEPVIYTRDGMAGSEKRDNGENFTHKNPWIYTPED